MEHEIRHDPQLGKLLWLTDGRTELSAALDVGIRIVHLSVRGMENLFYRQPGALLDRTQWHLIGGHRFWLAPESPRSYYPDLDPVEYRLRDNAVTLTQPPDPWLQVQKSLELSFLPDGSIRVRWTAKNLGDHTIQAALWGIHTLRGGTGWVDFSPPGGDPYQPARGVALWGETDLGDGRIRFMRDRVTATYQPSDAYFKIGVYSAKGHIHHENLGQSLDITFPAAPREQCADHGSNAEIWLGKSCMELEAMGPMVSLQPHGEICFEAAWKVNIL